MWAFIEGDSSAMDQIILRRFTELLNFAIRLGVTRDDAEEVVQNVFIKMISYRDRWQETASLRTLLYTMTRNMSMDWHRKQKRHLKGLDFFRRNPKDTEEEKEDVGDAEAAIRGLHSLPPAQAQVLILVVMQGLSYQEAAEVLGVAVGTLKSRVHYALKKLRDKLGVHDG